MLWCCRPCVNEAKRIDRQRYSIGPLDRRYIALVLQGSQVNTQCTCLLDVGFSVQQAASGFARGDMHPTSLIHHPLVTSEAVVEQLSAVLTALPGHMQREASCQQCLSPAPATPTPPNASYEVARLTSILSLNLLRNPLMQNYTTVVERNGALISASVLSASISSAAEVAARARGPLAAQQAPAVTSGFGILVHQGNNSKPQHHALFVQDGLTPRPAHAVAATPNTPSPFLAATRDAGDDSDSEPASSDYDSEPDYDSCASSDYEDDLESDPLPAVGPAEPLITHADGTPVAGGGELGVSVEAGLFPMLYTHGRGWYAWAKNSCLTNYLRMRTSQVFSFFTLYLPFLLLMFVVHQQHMLAACLVDQVLQQDVARERRRNPAATESEIIGSLLKHRVPATLVGSPSYFRENLADLQCMVSKLGLPHLFLTLTSDEVSPTRWKEVDDLDKCLKG